MTDCLEMQLLVQADLDGELDPEGAARVAAHLAGCPACARLQPDLQGVSTALRRDWPQHAAPAGLRAAVTPKPVRVFGLRPTKGGWVAGLALAASLALAVLPPASDGVGMELVSGHIRALQPGHLIDVVSTDRHMVKPWFEGRVDFAPPVHDFAAEGFRLSGGRLDSIGGRTVAVLVYHHDRHPVDLYVWPGRRTAATMAEERLGYVVVGWAADGLEYRAVSDIPQSDLRRLAGLWQDPASATR